jgi:hypothetical protein
MEVTSSPIDREAAVVLSAVSEDRYATVETALISQARQLTACAFFLQNNFVRSLDGGGEVCMIRIKKSH